MTDTLYCSFCAKSQHEAHRLIAGPHVFVCDNCVMVMAAMLQEDADAPIEGRVLHGSEAHAYTQGFTS